VPGARASASDAGRPGPAAVLEGLRVAVPAEFLDESVDAGVRAAVEAALELLSRSGASVRRLPPGSLPNMRHSIPVYYIVSSSEACSNLSRFDGIRYGPRREGDDLLQTYERTRGELFGAEVRRRIMLGTFALSSGYYEAWYKKALSVRRLIQRELLAVLEEHDLIAGPVSPFPAFGIGERATDPYQMYLCDLLTAPVCLAGMPSVSLPVGLTPARPDRPPLPVGLQLTGRLMDDHRVLAVGAALEALRGEPERSPLFARAAS